MTRISKYSFAAAACGLLVAVSNSVFAQPSAGERYARTLADADITARFLCRRPVRYEGGFEIGGGPGLRDTYYFEGFGRDQCDREGPR